MKKIFTALLILLISFTSPVFANESKSLINETDSQIQFFADYESGFLSVLHHTIQIGTTGSNFNYVTQGGQDILFPFERFNVGAVINNRHRVSILYQPLELNTVVPFEGTIIIDKKNYTDVPMELKYSFPFWRISYSYDLIEDSDIFVGIGASLQIRNASIVFKEVNGTDVSVSQNVGPVPALHIYSMWKTPFGLNLSSDITGLYASSSFINGASFEFEGSILDASLRAGYVLKNNIELFANVRFLGGTAKGSSNYSGSNWSVASSDDRYTQNNLATLSATLGLSIR